MEYSHLLTELCHYEETSRSSTGRPLLNDEGEPLFTGVIVPIRCMHLRRQRLFRTQGAAGGDAGRRVSNHELVTETEIPEWARVWYPGKDYTDVNQALDVIQIKNQSRPYGGLILFHTYL